MTVELWVAGYANMDYLARVPRLPAEDGRVTALSTIACAPGGMAANVACAAATLGAAVHFFGQVGDNEDGHLVLADLTARGVDTGGVEIGQHTSRCLILVEPNGDRAIVSEPLDFSYRALDAALEAGPQRGAAALYTDGHRLIDAQPRLARAGSLGFRRVVDLDGLPATAQSSATLPALLREIDVLLLNRDMANLLWPDGDVRDGVAALIAAGPRIVVLTGGATGAALCTRGGDWIQIPGYPVEVRDTTGAGDVFTAAFTVSWLDGAAPDAAARFAAVAAALSTRAEGARGALPGRAQVQQALEGR